MGLKVTWKIENLSVQAKSAPFRADIQGLRALAVLAVVLFHLSGSIAPNGFVGVDVFFVISGYVITASTWRIKSANPISFLSSFFRKRLARLVPALFVCLTLTEFFLFILQPSGNAKLQAIQTGLYAFSGTSNLFLLEILNNYWFEGLRLNPFVHTWSLGVEFQFYLVFPLLFLAFLVIFNNRMHPAIWIAPLIVIIIYSTYLFLAAPAGSLQAFYLSHYRFWEFLLGVGAYAITTRLYAADAPPTNSAHGGLVLQKHIPTLLLVAIFFSNRDILPQAWAVAVACLLSTALIIINSRNRWCESGLLSGTLLKQIGDASYSIYLFHWPVIVIYGWVRGFESPIDYAACLTIVAAFSLFSWKLVEPRNKAIGRLSYGPAFALAIMIVAYGIADRPHAFRGFGILGPSLGPAYEYFIWSVDPYSLHNEWWRLFESKRRAANPATQSDIFPEIIRSWNEDLGTHVSTVHFSGDRSGKTIIVLGDSYVTSAMAMIVDYAARTGTSVIAYQIMRCANETKCAAAFRNVQSLAISKAEDIAFVFFASRPKEPHTIFNRYIPPLIAALNKTAIPLIMQGPTPTFTDYNPRMCLSPFKQSGASCLGYVPAHKILAYRQKVETWQSGYTDRFTNVHIWRPWDMFCDENVCRYGDKRLSYFRDEDHLSVRGSLFLTDHFSDYVAGAVPAERLAH